MNTNPRELRSQREDLIKKASALIDKAEAEKRDFTAEEQLEYDGWLGEADTLEKRAIRIESQAGLEARLASGQAPAVLKIRRGDSEARAIAHYARTGDMGGVSELSSTDQDGVGITIQLPRKSEMRAVKDETMVIATAADGGSLVPTGFSGQIAARKNEIKLADKLGCRMIPGKGTTVNFPYDNAEPQLIATVTEQVDALTTKYERDAPIIGSKAFTLVKKARRVELTEELLDDEDVGVLDFLADWIGREIGITHNTALLVEAAASGTSLKTFAAAAAIAAGEPESVVFNSALGFYLDDATPGKWVMRNPTFGAIASITGNPRLYAQTPGGSFSHEILGYDVFLSTAAAAIAASAKSVYFGNWFYMGLREDPALRIIRDPYSVDGAVVMKYAFRLVYGVLQPAALGFGVHPSA